MPHCLHCRHEYQSPADADAPIECPACGEDPRDDASVRWAVVARMSNLAEVGYFCDRLAEADIPTRVQDHDQFEAITGHWSRQFLVEVPQSWAEEAVEQLHLAADQETAPPAAPAAADPRHRGDQLLAELSDQQRSSTGSVWMPVALALVAGGIASWVARDVAFEPAAPRTETHPGLWHALTESDGPLVTPTPAAEPIRRLRFDPQRRRFVLDEDTTGDGRYDRRREFREDGAVIEVLR